MWKNKMTSRWSKREEFLIILTLGIRDTLITGWAIKEGVRRTIGKGETIEAIRGWTQTVVDISDISSNLTVRRTQKEEVSR